MEDDEASQQTTCKGDEFMDNPYTMMNCHIVSFAKALAEFKLNTPKGTYEGVGLGGLVQTLEGYALELQNRLSVIADFHSFLEQHGVGPGQPKKTKLQRGEAIAGSPEVYLRLLPRILELLPHQKGASRNLQFAQSLIQIAKEDNVASFTEAVMRDVLSKPLWASHPDLIYLTINHSAVMNKFLAKWVFTTRHFPMDVLRDMVKQVLEKGDCDRDVSKFVLSRPPFNADADLKDIVLKRRLGKRVLGEKVDLKEGTIVKTDKYKLKVLSCGGKGNTGAVYKAQTQDGRIVGLKVCVKYEPEQIISMQREQKKMEYLAELKVVPYTAILEAGDDYCVKEWVEGITGVEWFAKWTEGGCSLDDESFVLLLQLFRDVASTGVYLQNFKPQNLLWDGSSWQVVDYGGNKTIPDKGGVLKKYCDKFDKMWNKRKDIVPPLMELLKQAERQQQQPVIGAVAVVSAAATPNSPPLASVATTTSTSSTTTTMTSSISSQHAEESASTNKGGGKRLKKRKKKASEDKKEKEGRTGKTKRIVDTPTNGHPPISLIIKPKERKKKAALGAPSSKMRNGKSKGITV